jgi:hypothetical protein
VGSGLMITASWELLISFPIILSLTALSNSCFSDDRNDLAGVFKGKMLMNTHNT